MVAHVVPIRLSARDIFVRCAGVLALTPLSAPNAPSLAIVKSLFDLTPAEARVARDLAEGKTVADIASGAGASESTIRTHVRGVLEKTCCTERAVSLLRVAQIPVGEVADEVGLSTAAHFVATFRATMGVTPGAMRDALVA